MVDNRMMINQPIQPTRKTNRKSISPGEKQKRQQKSSFKEVFAEKLKEKSGVKFSKHAQNRLLSRNIEVTEKELNQLQDGIEKAEDKGARDSLIMVDKVAYVVSVENKTVITAIDDENIRENVFTNIDSAVFM